MSSVLSNKQFTTENYLREQGNEDKTLESVRGFQNMTSNKFVPSFSSDYTTVHSMPSGTQFRTAGTGGGMEEEEDEE